MLMLIEETAWPVQEQNYFAFVEVNDSIIQEIYFPDVNFTTLPV